MLRLFRRKKLDKIPFPPHWQEMLRDKVYHYRMLSPEKQNKLNQLIRYFLTEKSFEECGGMKLDEEKKAIIASLCCYPLLGGVSDLYPLLRSVLIYPSEYQVHFEESGEDGVMIQGTESRSGESWDRGVLVFSWEEILYDLRYPRDGANIIFHECAHQLDYEWGATLDTSMGTKRQREGGRLPQILKDDYQRLNRLLDMGRRVPVDEYAATNIHEFFAVMSEYYFERPEDIVRHFPKTAQSLKLFYDPGP